MFWRSNNDQNKRMKNFYPKGFKLDFCSIPLSEADTNTKIELGYCGNTNWSFVVEKKNEKVSVNLNCEPANSSLSTFDQWSVHADVMVRIQHHKCIDKSITASGYNLPFDRKDEKGHNWNHTFDKAQVTEKNGFLRDGFATFQIQIGMTEMEGLYSGNFIDFSVSRDGESDIILTVGEKKFHVSKQILSIYSPVFKAMFHGNFNEKEMSEIPINNVDLNAFHIFLQYLYMAPIEICDENVSQLLLMGDQFVVKKLTRECENYLMRKNIHEKDAIDLAIFHSLDRVLCDKIKKKSVEELAVWWSLGQPLPPVASNLLTEKLGTAPKPELKPSSDAKPTADPAPESSHNSDSESESDSHSGSDSDSDSDSDA